MIGLNGSQRPMEGPMRRACCTLLLQRNYPHGVGVHTHPIMPAKDRQTLTSKLVQTSRLPLNDAQAKWQLIQPVAFANPCTRVWVPRQHHQK